MERAGIDFSKNTYDPKFLTDLIEYEYKDLVKEFRKNKDDIAREIDGALGELTHELTSMGLAQLS